MSDPVLPPALGLWWDVEATYTAVMSTLRLAEHDIDGAAVTAAISAAAGMIDQYIDSDVALVVAPDPLLQALQQLAIELYRRKDAPSFRSVSAGTDRYDDAIEYVDDVLAGVEPLLRPFRRRWGIA